MTTLVRALRPQAHSEGSAERGPEAGREYHTSNTMPLAIQCEDCPLRRRPYGACPTVTKTTERERLREVKLLEKSVERAQEGRSGAQDTSPIAGRRSHLVAS